MSSAQPFNPRIPRANAMLLVVAALVGGCAGLNTTMSNLGDDALDQLRELQPEIFAIERQLADSAGLFLRQALEDQVLSTSRTTLDGMLGQTRQETDLLIGQIAGSIRGDLNRSLQAMLDENFELAEVRAARLAEMMVTTAILEATRSMDTLIAGAVATASTSIRRDLSPVLIDVIDHLTDSLTATIRELRTEVEGTGRSIIAWLAGGLAVVALVVGAVWFALRNLKRERRNVGDVVFEAIARSPPGATVEQLKQTIKGTAQRKQGYGYLTTRLEEFYAANPDVAKPPSDRPIGDSELLDPDEPH